MTSLPSSFTRPRTLSASSSESSASSSSSSSTKSWSEGNFDLTSRGTSNTTSQQHVLLRTQFWEHASASNATTGLRSEKRSHLSNNASSTSLDRRGSTGSRKRRTSQQVVSESAVRSLAVPGRVVQLETPRTRTLTLALSKFSLKDNGTEGPERADEGQAESPQPKAEAEAHRPLKSSLASVSGPLSARSGSIKSQRKRREPSSPTESSPPGGKETPKRPTIVIIGSTPTSSVGQGTARPTHGRSLSLDIPDLLRYRSRTSPTPSTPSPPSSALSSPALSSDRAYYTFPPSPIPSFPPFTPQQHSPELPGDTVRILQPTTQPSNDIPHLTPSNPAYFIVPSTCDKRRRTVSSAPRHKSSDEALAPRPIKKRKQATNGALVPMFESPDANNGRPPLPALMPTAIDVVDFIKSKGGQCHEGDVFFRFRTGENEHVRNVVNMILDQFAIPLLGPDRRSRYRFECLEVFDNNGLREFGDENEAVGSQGANCGTFSAFDQLLSQAATTVNNKKSSSPVMASTPGKCAIRGSCGSKGRFGPQLPCPYDGPPQEVEEDDFRTLLASVCGPELANSPVCCTAEQVQTLQSNFQQAETIISSCPACRNNFREFYCKFTCSPDQGDFISVTSTQETSTGETAVKSLDFRVSEQMGQGFFDSCKNVKFSATNGYAMDFIGGGAKNYSAFLQYMGDERPGLGSPFQINFPAPSNELALDYRARDCSDSDLGSRCACIDCPNVCAVLPPIETPSAGSHCQIGAISCLSFVIIVAYALAVTSFITGFGIMAWRRKRNTSERAPLLDSNSVNGVAATVDPPNRASLVGASSLAQRDADQSSGALSDPRGLGHGLQNLINPFESSPPAYRLNTRIRRFFYRLGSLCASYPWLTLAAASVFIAGLNLGWTRFAVEVDPVRLWVPPTSETKIQKEYFDEHFGPFYRTQQIFISRAPSQEGEVDKGDGDEPVLSWDVLRWWMDIEEDIRNLRSSSNGYTLRDVCFKPAGPRGACVVQSIGAWFGNDLSGWDPDTWQEQVLTCASNPSACLPDYGQPLGPKYVLGGVPESNSPKRWLDAQAMVVTYVVSDSNDLNERAKAEEWERELKSYLEGVANSAQAEEGVQIAYSTGVSLEEEINQSTNTDVRIVVLSYLVMFLYISMTLGGGSAVPDPDEKNVSILLRKWVGRLSGVVVNQEAEPQSSSFSFRTLSRKTLVGSKFMLGLFGILLVIVSVSTSVGLFSFLGVKVTLIIAEVIPFLVLAVGVDNVFILVHELDRQNSLHGPNAPLHLNEASGGAPISPASYRSPFESQDSGDAESAMRSPLPAEERVARAVAKMGPSILLSSLTETIAFALGALVPMPAVRNFALYAAGSVFLGAVLQVTAFVAALTIDLRREEDNRVDCLPCIKIPQRIVLPTQHTSPRPGVLTRFMQKYYAPFLLKDSVKSAVVAAFAGLFAASVISMQHIKLGLDQRLALPSTSYLVPYFDAVDKYLDIGPPVYFVSTANNVTARDGQQNICGRFTTCDDYSLMNTLEGERNRPEASFIAEPPAGWFDDFFRWLDPQIDSCCRVRKTDPSVFCSARTPARLCKPCFEDRRPEWNITLYGMPEGEEFMRYLRQWLISPTDDECPLGGMAAYGSALALTDDGVEASHFRTFHTPLKSQDDFINAFASANRIANDISERTGTKVFPYSLFYVFFEQYIYIINITQEILGLGLAAVLIVTSVLLGSWRTGTIVTGVVGLTVVNVMGVMGIWGISLNAISLVNLVISLGIAVEFCSHIARAFMSAGPGLPADDGNSPKERNGRVWTALADVGPSVLSGITFTKLIGMSVLALTRSKLLEIYYFRMWLTLIISGALHGLVLLPVVLSLAGGPGFRDVDEDEEWMANAIRSADQEYAPFRTSSDFGDSD